MSAIILPGDVVSSPWGKFHEIEGMTDGTIFLWDAGLAGLTSMPEHNASLTNYAADQGANLLGLTPDKMGLNVSATNFSGGSIAGEITEKGGVHIASTQAGGQSAPASWAIHTTNADLKQKLLDNTDMGDDYALLFTLWLTKTREGVNSGNASPQAIIIACNNASATGNYLAFMTQAGGYNRGEAIDGVAPVPPGPVGEPKNLSISSRGWAGSRPAGTGNFLFEPARLGAGSAWASLNYNKAMSGIIYRVQVDILQFTEFAGSLTEKANATLAALNSAHSKAFGAGGRFYNDTYTPPATLKP